MNPRIISGIYKNRRLKVPDVARPITDRVKTVMFDKLSEVLEGSNGVDLFAGSGSIGIEALSRGVKHMTFVERSFEGIQALEDNLITLKVPKEDYKVTKQAVESFLKSSDEKFELIFIDPPFKLFEEFNFLQLENIATKDSIIILKTPEEFDTSRLVERFTLLDQTKVGVNVLVYMRVSS